MQRFQLDIPVGAWTNNPNDNAHPTPRASGDWDFARTLALNSPAQVPLAIRAVSYRYLLIGNGANGIPQPPNAALYVNGDLFSSITMGIRSTLFGSLVLEAIGIEHLPEPYLLLPSDRLVPEASLLATTGGGNWNLTLNTQGNNIVSTVVLFAETMEGIRQ